MLGFLLGSRGSNQREQLDGTDRLEESVQGGSDLLRVTVNSHFTRVIISEIARV